MADTGNLVFIGDIHIDRVDADLEDFLEFLDRLERTTSRIVLIGDLFNVWIGRRELESEHHTRVVERLRELRSRGVVVRYVEGNRDFRIGSCYAGSALDDVTQAGLHESIGGHGVFAVHGDMANRADRQYRAWRRFARTGLVWALFNLLPAASRRRLAERLHGGLDTTNRSFKGEFPESVVREYASAFLDQDVDTVVLGHYHVEKDLPVERPRRGRILVLPEWKESRRHLELDRAGGIRFVDS